ncbi:MAG: ATP-binding protein [Acidimicrobiales bacterium]
MAPDPQLASALEILGTRDREITVTLSNELVHLLSEQMYQSPIKAVEELVVNAWDADAQHCRLFIPLPPASDPMAVIFDDGEGMDADGLEDLWHIGHSRKRQGDELSRRLRRRQIGKFGIGKLATYAVANTVTYVTYSDADVYAVTMNFDEFASDPSGGQPMQVNINRLELDAIFANPSLATMFEKVGMSQSDLAALPSWTLVVLEELKPKMGRIRTRDLNWVLSTAMPYKSDFHLTLNGNEVQSRKSELPAIASFTLAELPATRVQAIEEALTDNWRIEGEALVSDSFPQGITGEVVVTKSSLYTGKSNDLARSHGFFVKVHERLVEESDSLFGIEPLSYSVWNRFRADIIADDLDKVVTAPRERFEESDLIREFRHVLREIFYEARTRYESKIKEDAEKEKKAKTEERRDYVSPTFVEHPIADALLAGTDSEGSDADETWFYLRLGEDVDVRELAARLYEPERARYKYADFENGRSGRLVSFDPGTSTFYLNVDHPVVQAHSEPDARPLLEDLVTAEALLEVYLREQGMSRSLVGDILERRDSLLRSLASDRLFSLTAIAGSLRSSYDDERDLEVNLVIAARALGFVAKHLSGASNPDGVAKYSEYPGGEKKITLEAKSSADVPSLGAIDFAGLAQHVADEEGATGCLLVAPSYPGNTRGDDAQAARRARENRISCWTVDQLANLVETAEERHISAADVLNIVLTAFTPDEVTAAITNLLDDESRTPRELYQAVIEALRALDGRLPDRPRSLDLIATEITGRGDFAAVQYEMIRKAMITVANASQGLLQITGRKNDQVVVRGSYDELERRVSQLLGRTGIPRRESTFRAPTDFAEGKVDGT